MATTLQTKDMDALNALIRDYLRAASSMTAVDLAECQHPPYASIAFGMLGIAYASWRAALRGSKKGLSEAHRWLQAARRFSRRPSAFVTPVYPASESDRLVSLPTGPDGARVLALLLAHHRRDRQAFRMELKSFATRTAARRRRPSDFMLGDAAYLLAATSLHRAIPDPRLQRLANMVARRILRRAARASCGWAHIDLLGFARGRAGVFYALLDWSLSFSRPLPASFFQGLVALAAEVEQIGTAGAPLHNRRRPPPWLQRSWCNGSAGMTLLWLKAYEHSGSAEYLELARAAATFTLGHRDSGPADLCCGLGGRAYACLAMHRFEPGAWRRHAVALAARATQTLESPWQHGLLRGYPGLVCLAFDLLDDRPRGFPMVES
jgi:hypothetical protein